jgi:hypothetical protein
MGDARTRSMRSRVAQVPPDVSRDPRCVIPTQQVSLTNCPQVFREVGLRVLDALVGGYNACVLAYGQSGTGKTFTMMGRHVSCTLYN